MRQRVVIAMAMANDPEVLIADEPTTALDVTVQAQILETLDIAREETQAAMILITHDLGVVAGIADRVLVMYAGKPVEIGEVDDIYYHAADALHEGPAQQHPPPRRPEWRGPASRSPARRRPWSTCRPAARSCPRCPYRIDICDDVEPELLQVDGLGHRAACHVSEPAAARRPDLVPGAGMTTPKPAKKAAPEAGRARQEGGACAEGSCPRRRSPPRSTAPARSRC